MVSNKSVGIKHRHKKNYIYHLWNDLPYKRVLFNIKIFTKLPLNVLKLYTNTTPFKSALRKFLVKNPFYSTDEFLSTNCGVN